LAHQSSVDRQPVIPDGGLSPALQEFELAKYNPSDLLHEFLSSR
jgi:hypothetical protein